MISIKKLYKEGKMYMNPQEIRAIQRGSLKEYLAQFSVDEEDLNFKNLANQNQEESDVRSVGLPEEESAKKIRYRPDAQDINSFRGEEMMFEQELIRGENGCGYNPLASKPSVVNHAVTYGVV